MTPTLWLDLETAPAPWTLERGLRAAHDAVPGNISRPETVAKWVEEHASDAWLATSLDPMAGCTLCVGYAIDGGPVRVLGPYADPYGDEPRLLRELADVVPRRALWAGHGLRGFDAPWLMRRALLHGVYRLAAEIPWDRHGDKYREDGKRAIDTRDLWMGGAWGKGGGKLDDIARFLGLRTKADSGMSGADVWRAWGEGRGADVARYCADDVSRCRDVAIRLWRADVIRADWPWAEEGR